MKNLVPFLKSWGILLPDRWPNFSPHLFPMFFNFGQKSWKNHLFCPPYYSPTIYINRKMIFHFFSATIRYLLLTKMRYEHAVFGKISPIYPFWSTFGSILSIFYHFAQKWLCFKVIGRFPAPKTQKFEKNHHVSHFDIFWENGLSYEKSGAIFEILRKFASR